LDLDGTGGGGDGLDIAGDSGEGEGWGMDEELDLGLEPDELAEEGDGAAGGSYFVAPTVAPPQSQMWVNNSPLAADHAAAGAFDTAMENLHKQIGIVDFEPFRPYFLAAFAQARTANTGITTAPCMLTFSHRNWMEAGARNGLPPASLKLSSLIEALQSAYKSTTEGKFGDALVKMRKILYAIPMLVVDSKQDAEDAESLVGICAEYILGLTMELERRDIAKEPSKAGRAAELAAYFTHCDLQPMHLMLTLRTAQTVFFKLKNFKTCASFARRLLELGPRPDLAATVCRGQWDIAQDKRGMGIGGGCLKV